MYEIKRYTPSEQNRWDTFVSEARNSSLLFMRDYMDYHADRFDDFSLMAYKGARLSALLPANLADGVLHSHQGLTFGGWILPRKHIDGSDLLEIFQSAMEFCRKEGISAIDYKTIPTIYHEQPSEEDFYCLTRLGGIVTECRLSESIRLASNPGLNTLRRRHLRKAADYSIREAADDPLVTGQFYVMLCECLAERHSTRPVHTLQELSKLHLLFPENIRIFIIDDQAGAQAGVCIYSWHDVAHCQYIASTQRGRELNLLTPLFSFLIDDVFADCRYFDFGTSNEADGSLNDGLLRQKASYGASGISYPRFLLKL